MSNLTAQEKTEKLDALYFDLALRAYTQPPFTKEYIMKNYELPAVVVIFKALQEVGETPYDPNKKPEVVVVPETKETLKPTEPDTTITDAGLRALDLAKRSQSTEPIDLASFFPELDPPKQPVNQGQQNTGNQAQIITDPPKVIVEEITDHEGDDPIQ